MTLDITIRNEWVPNLSLSVQNSKYEHGDSEKIYILERPVTAALVGRLLEKIKDHEANIGKQLPLCFNSASINQDGSIHITDVQYMQHILDSNQMLALDKDFIPAGYSGITTALRGKYHPVSAFKDLELSCTCTCDIIFKDILLSSPVLNKHGIWMTMVICSEILISPISDIMVQDISTVTGCPNWG